MTLCKSTWYKISESFDGEFTLANLEDHTLVHLAGVDAENFRRQFETVRSNQHKTSIDLNAVLIDQYSGMMRPERLHV